MKLKQVRLTFVAALALGLAGCDKTEPTSPTAEEANKTAVSAAEATAKTVESAKFEATKVADTAKAEAAKVAEAAKTEAAKAADYAKSQGLIDKAKGLIAEGKFTEASTMLQQLAGQTLNADQTKLVASLKEQIQKALAAKATADAAGALGGFPKK